MIFVNGNSITLEEARDKYKRSSKLVIASCNQEIEELNVLDNIRELVLIPDSKIVRLPILKDLQLLQIEDFGMCEQIYGLESLENLIDFSYKSLDTVYNKKLQTNIVSQIDFLKVLQSDQSSCEFTFFMIPILQKKYNDFFKKFKPYDNKIKFVDKTNEILDNAQIVVTTFNEAKQADEIAENLIFSCMKHSKNKLELFANLYNFVINNIGYDYSSIAKNGKVISEKANGIAQALINRKVVCTGFSQVLKYLANKCDLTCEYVQASYLHNIKLTESGIFRKQLTVIPKDNQNNWLLPNHAIVRFLADNENWLFCDPTNDSYFVSEAKKRSISIKRWPFFCLPRDEMELYNNLNACYWNTTEYIKSDLTKTTKNLIDDAMTKIIQQQTLQEFSL